MDVIRKCNFKKIILKFLKNKLYVGSSAGSYIACPSVEMGLWKKPNRETYGLKDFKGMGLVDFMVFAHYEDIYKDFIEEKRKEIPMKIYELTDDQAISIENGKFKFIN